jgi:uncharacterized SAM-binding protein YcdF (DUF218 family)
MMSILGSVLPNLYLWIWLAAAIVILRATSGKRTLRRVGVLLLIISWLAGSRPVVDVILHPLEGAFDRPSVDELRRLEVRDVVVLGGGGYPLAGEQLSSALSHASTHRFLGGVELCSRLGPDCRLVFSGAAGRAHRDIATAEIMRKLADRLLPETVILSEVRSGSTAEHPAEVEPLLASEAGFALVTSAYHMPRAMRSFRRAGLEPIAFPVDSLSQGETAWMDWLPSSQSFWNLNVGLREYFAVVLYAIMGW